MWRNSHRFSLTKLEVFLRTIISGISMKKILNLIVYIYLVFSFNVNAEELNSETLSFRSPQLENPEGISQSTKIDSINLQPKNTTENESINQIETKTDSQDTSIIENSYIESSANTSDLNNSTKEINSSPLIFTEEESTYLSVALIFFIVLIPFIPGYILKGKVRRGNEIVFAHLSEMRAYQVAGFLLILSSIMWLNVSSINLKIITVTVGVVSILFLVALLGFQKVISKNLRSALTIYLLKILFVAFGTLVVFLGTAISFIAFRSAKENLNKRKYGDAAVNTALATGAAASTASFSSNYFGENSLYINGPNYEDFAGAFPDKGIIDVIKIGIKVVIVSIFLWDEKIYLEKILKNYRETGNSLF